MLIWQFCQNNQAGKGVSLGVFLGILTAGIVANEGIGIREQMVEMGDSDLLGPGWYADGLQRRSAPRLGVPRRSGNVIITMERHFLSSLVLVHPFTQGSGPPKATVQLRFFRP